MRIAKQVVTTLGIGAALFAVSYLAIPNAVASNGLSPITSVSAQHQRAALSPVQPIDLAARSASTHPGKIVYTYPKPDNGADVNANTNIWVMDVDGSNRTQLTTFGGLDRQPAISPDGTKIAYISYQGNRDTLWVMNSDGTNPVQLPVSGSSAGIAWSPDGSKIAFGNDSVDWWEIWVINADGSNLQRLTTHGPAAGHPTWSPDGQKLAYGVNPAAQFFDMYTVNSDGTGQSLLISTSTGFSNHYVAWSPDGTQIAAVHWPAGSNGPYELWLMNADGSGGNAIATNIEWPDQNITWSSDGNWIIFGKDGQTWRVRRDGTNLTQITTTGSWEPSASVESFALTRRGSAIAFVRPQPETGANVNVWIMDIDGSNQTELTTYSHDDRQPVISPDGTQIAYLSLRNSKLTLWTMNSDGTNPLQVPFTGQVQIPAWSPDGSKIALQGDAEDGTWWEVWIINADGSNPHRITSHAEAAGSPSWSPDGTRLVYLSEPSALYHNLYIINSDGTGQTELSSAYNTGYSHHRPAWSPDGTQIATIRFAAGTLGPYDLWVMNSNGSGGQVIAQEIDSYNVNRISWSPDSSTLYFAKNGQIWSVKRDGTQLTQITTTGGWEPSVGPELNACLPQASESDILLVVDRSGSMANDNKLNDAKLAISAFISVTNAPPDQLGLVSFSGAATLDQSLTANKALVNAAAQALTAGGGTRIDLGLQQARLELVSSRHVITHTKVIILLTDGHQNPPPNDPVLAEAAAAKAEGATIYTIGLGPDADAALLQQVATSPSHYYFAPTGTQLAEIYQQISAAISCHDIGGQVYVDRDNNSQYTPGTDTPFPNVTVRMTGQVARQTASQSNGSYRFANNPTGTYTVTVDVTSVLPSFTPISPTTYVISLTSSNDLDNHFGFRPPSGERAIAFVRPQPEAGLDSNIWVMDANGANQIQLTAYPGDDRWPALSPDGSKIAYVSWRDNRYTLWMMNSDGTNPVQLPVSGSSMAPAWSPNGGQIAFNNDAVDWWEIWVINADGSNLQRLTSHGPAAGLPSWSPDGQKIVYGVDPTTYYHDLYVVNSDGTGQSLLISTSTGFSNHHAAWSSDGAQIATLHWPAGSAGPRDLWLMNANGSGGTTLVTDIEPHKQNISWSADGSWLVFSKNGQVWRVDRYGKQLAQIGTGSGWEPSTSAYSFGAVTPPKYVFLPVVTRNYCAGPIVDDFSNPASGWPIAETASWSYAYVNGEYRTFAKSAATAAVSRGERPIGQFVVEVDMRLASGVTGSAGILFGLTDDWSEFYTFEIYTDIQYYAVWRHQGGNWYLLQAGQSSAILPGQNSNRLRISLQSSGGYFANLYVNGTYLTTTTGLSFGPTMPRRVGLTSSAEAAGFDARFDNWKIVPEGCPSSSQPIIQLSGDAPAEFFESVHTREWNR